MITVEGTPPPVPKVQGEPVVVDLSQTDQADIQLLYKNFCQMFPNTSKLYLEQQASELVGKHAAINRFIDELFTNDAKPPEYWKPDVLPVWESAVLHEPSEVSQKNGTTGEISSSSEQHQPTEGNALTISAEKDESLNRKIPSLDNYHGSCLQGLEISSRDDNTNLLHQSNKNIQSLKNEVDQYDNPMPGPSGIQKNNYGQNELPFLPYPTDSVDLTKMSYQATTNQGKIDIIELENTEQPTSTRNLDGQAVTSTEVTDTEEERREQQMDKRVQNLLSLFPQKDPEFLRAKNNEFGLDAAGITAFETWVLEVVENGGKDLPSREDYERRKKVIYKVCLSIIISILPKYNN